MTIRITRQDLENIVHRLNIETGEPTELHDADGNTQTGHYYIAGAYGGYRLEQVDGPGARDISPRGTKKELYNIISTAIKIMQAY